MLGLLVMLVPPWWPVLIVVDETVERRQGRKIKAKGRYRDAVRSTQKVVVKGYGLKWISMRVLVALPWSTRPWALAFLTVLAPSKRANEAAGKRHKTSIDWTADGQAGYPLVGSAALSAHGRARFCLCASGLDVCGSGGSGHADLAVAPGCAVI